MYVPIATSLDTLFWCAEAFQKMELDSASPLTSFWSQVGRGNLFHKGLIRTTKYGLAKKVVRNVGTFKTVSSLRHSQQWTQAPAPRAWGRVNSQRSMDQSFRASWSMTLFLWRFVLAVQGLLALQEKLVSRALRLIIQTADHAEIDICIFELEDQSQVDDLCQFLEAEADNIAAVWIAPSCGTASKARERRLPQLKKLGIAVPIPLRSHEQPDQIDGLANTDKVKVERANMLYSAVEQITRTTCRAKIFTGIENPANSHYWGTTPMQNIMEEFGRKFVTFHNCSHGGSRDKLTSIWVNDDWLDALEARCDNSHSHKSWKVTVTDTSVHFPTSEEAAYPQVLCQRIVECVKQRVSATRSDSVHNPC